MDRRGRGGGRGGKHHWSPQQAETALATVFSDIKMLRQRRTRSGCAFSFRGSHATHHDMIALPLEDADGRPTQVLWCRWAPAVRTVQRQSIRTTGSWSLLRPPDPFSTTETVKQPGGENSVNSPQTGEEAQSTPNSAGQVGEKKKTEPPAGPAAKRRQAEQRVVPEGLTLKSVPGDGNCLFASFAAGHAAATGKSAPMHHLQLRAELVQHLLKHIDTYSSQWDKEMPSGEIGDSFEKYIEEVAKPKTWCGLLELKALSRMYDSRITVIPRAPTETVFSVKPSQEMHRGTHV